MKEYLVDVLNAHDTVLHVFPIVLEEHDIAPEDEKCLQEALRAAIYMQLVPEAEIAGLRARAHVGRRGRLAPVSDGLRTRRQLQDMAGSHARPPLAMPAAVSAGYR